MDYNLYLRCSSFSQGDEYLLLDAILCSSCFSDGGMVEFDKKPYLRYILKFVPPVSLQSPLSGYADNMILTADKPNQVLENILSTYGLHRKKTSSLGLPQFSFSASNLLLLSNLAKEGVRPSKKVIADAAYWKWLSKGKNHGHDMADWLSAECDMTRRIEAIMRRFSIRNH